MPNNQPNSEPDFTGETMRMPGAVPTSTSAATTKGKSLGIVFALLFIALLIILGGLYFWYLNRPQPVVVIPEPTSPAAEENPASKSTAAETQADAFNTVSTSNDLDTIEADIRNSNLDSLDAELTTIDTEVEGSNGTTTP